MSSLGKSSITVAWKPMLAAAIQYSKNENQLKAINNPKNKYQINIFCQKWHVYMKKKNCCRTQNVTVYTVFNKENAETKSAQKGQEEEPTFEKVGPLLGPFTTEISHFEDSQNY